MNRSIFTGGKTNLVTAVTVMKTTFPKAKPTILYYRDYKNFNLYNFRTDLMDLEFQRKIIYILK